MSKPRLPGIPVCPINDLPARRVWHKRPEVRKLLTDRQRAYRARNREYVNSLGRAWYARHAEKRRTQRRQYMDTVRQVLNDLKVSKGCIDCGYNAHPAALDFDHVTGEKKSCVAEAKNRGLKAALAEAAKCVVRCANCHRIISFKQRQEHFRRLKSIL